MHEVSERRGNVRDLQAFIHQLRLKGVMLWKEDGGLRYRAPRGALTAAERQALSSANEEIALLLPSASGPLNSSVAESPGTRQAPLSFTQLEHWYDRLRHGGQPIRHMASAFRLHGPLRVDLLKESVGAVAGRHDALRTRIVLCDGGFPVQEVADKHRAELEVIPLDSVPEAYRESAVELEIRRAILDTRDYAVSPLFKAALLAIDGLEYILVLALDHMISDLASLHLLSSEVFTAYSQLLAGHPIDLPPVAVQFPDHAARLRRRPMELLTRVGRRSGSIGRTRFPDDSSEKGSARRTGLGSARFVIDKNLTDELRVWARAHGTTIVVATLAAYAALVLRWCNVKETVIGFMTDGRTSADLEHTIGYLAFAVYVRVVLDEQSTFLNLLKTVVEESCRAHDEADFGYAIAQTPPPPFTRNTAVNWLPSGSAPIGNLANDGDAPISWSAVEFENPVYQLITECDAEPGVSFCEKEGVIVGQVDYPGQCFSEQAMERFTNNITVLLTAMLRTPTRKVMDVALK